MDVLVAGQCPVLWIEANNCLHIPQKFARVRDNPSDWVQWTWHQYADNGIAEIEFAGNHTQWFISWQQADIIHRL